jgi:multiple sugar transport system permease protein
VERETAPILSTRVAVAFASPGMVLIGVFLIFPALWTLFLGLREYNLLGLFAAKPHFVGLDNYRQAFSDPEFRNALKLSLIYVFGSAVIGQMALGFALAWKLRDWHNPLRRLLEALVVFAWIIPSSVVAFLWIAFLDGQSGTLNTILGVHTDWLLSHPLASIIVFNIWRGAAFSMLLFGAALNAVGSSHLETARLAGASEGQQLRDVVFPAIRGHVLTNVLLISLWTFNDFTPYLLTNGGPNNETQILPVYIYKSSITSGNLGYGAAVSTIMLAINLVIALFYLRLLREQR